MFKDLNLRNKVAISLITVISAIILIVILLTQTCLFNPADTPAQAEGSYRVPLDVYVLDSVSRSVDLTDDQIHRIVDGASDIWENYGIELYIYDGVKRPNITLSDMDVSLGISGNLEQDAIILANKVLGDTISFENFTVVKVFFIQGFYRAPNDPRQITGYSLYENGASFIGSDSNKHWTLAHELGHVFNAKRVDEKGRLNLMTEDADTKVKCYPTILNDEQYRSVINRLMVFRHYPK